LADAKKLRLKARPSSDISEVLPYLNAILENGLFNRHAPALSFNKEFRRINLYPNEITITKALNTTDAFQVIDEIKELINDTWAQKEHITPDYTKRVKPNVLQVYELLPKTNCKQCQEPTCLAFAAKLIQGEQKTDHCLPLQDSKNVELREALEELALVLG